MRGAKKAQPARLPTAEEGKGRQRFLCSAVVFGSACVDSVFRPPSARERAGQESPQCARASAGAPATGPSGRARPSAAPRAKRPGHHTGSQVTRARQSRQVGGSRLRRSHRSRSHRITGVTGQDHASALLASGQSSSSRTSRPSPVTTFMYATRTIKVNQYAWRHSSSTRPPQKPAHIGGRPPR